MELTANTEPLQKNHYATYTGRMSTFGGPDDKGVASNEGLALYDHSDVASNPNLFLDHQPPGTSGVARRLNPEAYYCAMRWNYHLTSTHWLRNIKVKISNQKGESVYASPVDWGPNIHTGRVIDMSPGAVKALGITTNDTVTVEVPFAE